MLTKEKADILDHLKDAKRIHAAGKGWLTPMFFGGHDGSRHHYLVKCLVGDGLAERRRRGGWVRPSYEYRITPAGRRAFANFQQTKPAKNAPRRRRRVQR